ncbi:HK97 family phage prohead protease [Pseudonocardia charpentierae]|uniref:HK97 family phage prohead protease n=1 Tax=Pseudonocardia charpentierae TaxID=3075545 RepID=A0ABU2NJ21_9PSEU|nr:HK97 family phage prohead protease [Pseudonocardia sp. DSM 45834]MDT0353731.1 HK97 family phage prohead protease [Pseudonocardia sp. DSM 45834]
MPDSKSTIGRVEIKSETRGEVEAVFATTAVNGRPVIDSHGDVYAPGAFEDGAEVILSAYGHAVWQGALPVGKGHIRVTDSEAIVAGRFFLDTTAGRDTFAVVRELGPRQQWSYGFDVLAADDGVVDGQKVRVLKQLQVHEVSPVPIGAGVGTRTLATKNASTPEDVFVKELMRFVGRNLEDALRHELEDIRHSLDLARLRDQPRADVLDIRRRFLPNE